MIRVIRHDAIKWLNSRFPCTLKTYQAMTRKSAQHAPYKVECFWAVKIGEECSIPVILPTAYYACALMSTEDLFDGAKAHNGEIIKLSPSALRTALMFRERLSSDKRSEFDLRSIFRDKDWRCPHADKPSKGKGKGKGKESETIQDECIGAAWEAEHERFLQFGFDVFDQSVVQPRSKDIRNPCDECATVMKEKEKLLRVLLWSRLPLYCGRNDWRTIQRQQEAADRGDIVS